ncbi:hypothetical protein [Nocardioides caldifontis]|uniref:hypothetical protein n=1 Tax=Nocardioides caldifontis TaxID=2588938 RepID=UPI0011E03178|nr:hypothetical protein [Nocardioides caldifontis]
MVQVRAPLPVRRDRVADRRRHPVPGRTVSAHEAVLRLQREAGNRAVTRLLGGAGHAGRRLVQRAPENPPVTTLTPSGTLTPAQWTTAYRAAVAKPTVAAYEALFRDIAVTAGMRQLPGFDLTTIPVSDGKTAKPGLNLTLEPAETGHTAWVDRNGTFGVRLRPTRKQPPDVGIAILLGPLALDADKGLSLRTVRHEMVHAWHKVKVLEAVRGWQASRAKVGLDAWLETQVERGTMTDLDLALVSKGAQDAVSDTEVLAYVEGFSQDFHRRAPTMAAATFSFFELLGVVETRKVFPWSNADPAVRREALARLRDYRATLGPDHQRLWKEWLDRERGKTVKNQPGRTEFLTALAAFVV